MLTPIESLLDRGRPESGSSFFNAALLPTNMPADDGAQQTIFLVGLEPGLAGDLAVQIGCFGYAVRTFPRPDAFSLHAGLGDHAGSPLPLAIQHYRPAALIVDRRLIDGDSPAGIPSLYS